MHSIRVTAGILLSFFLFGPQTAQAPHLHKAPAPAPVPVPLPELPQEFPEPEGAVISLTVAGQKRPLTLIPELQAGLTRYLRQHGNPIGAIVVVEVATGRILAMAQGQPPPVWGATTHAALYPGFPAASLFKIVPTIAIMDMARWNPNTSLRLVGSCGKVRPQAEWLRQSKPDRRRLMSLSRAFATSCNSYYAKMTLEYLGVGTLTHYAGKLGWFAPIPADFAVPLSPQRPPQATQAAVHTVGRYAAGFGRVGMSAVHAAWLHLLIARDGKPMPLRLFAEGAKTPPSQPEPAIFPVDVAVNLRQMMQRTVRSGTAASAFRARRYRSLRRIAGGKTGTLNSVAPDGLATWFAGVMPVSQPQVVVSAVVVNGPRWLIKGTHLGAEGLKAWQQIQGKEAVTAVDKPPARVGRLSRAVKKG